MDDLNNFLQLVDNSNDVKKYIYVVRGSEFNIDSNNEKVNIIKEIFLAYSKSKNKNIILLNTSCLYGEDFIEGKINSLKNLNKYGNSFGNYIHIKDFCKYLYIFAMHKIDQVYVELKSNEEVLINQLFTNDKIKSKKIKYTNILNYKFEYSIVNDINNGLNVKSIIKDNNKSINDNSIISLFEVIIMFVISEIFVKKFNNTFNIQYIDFRLIFMVIVAIYYKMRYSLLATSLVIISFMVANINSSHDLSFVLSNTDNWLTIIIYIVLTIIIRNKIEKYESFNKIVDEKIIKLKEEKRNRERNLKKYETRIKELNKELIIHDNSLSKVSNIISNYDVINKESIYNIFFDVFNEEGIVVYDFNDGCLYPENDINKLSLSKLNKLVLNKKIWVNKELDSKLPLYVVPICGNNKILYCVTIWSFDLSMVNNEFKNDLVSLSNIISYMKDSGK